MKLPLHKQLTNEEVARMFTFIAKILLLEPNNLFRARAYEEAADVVAHLPQPLAKVYLGTTPEEFERLMDSYPGIGKAIAAKLTELYRTGDIKELQKLVAAIPPGVYALANVHGIGAKKALKLTKAFGIKDEETAIGVVLAAARAGKVRDLEGFGAKSEQQIISQLEEVRHKGRILREQAIVIADQVAETIRASGAASEIVYLGSLRRAAATVGDIDIGVNTKDPREVSDYLLQHLPILARVLGSGEKTMNIMTTLGLQVDIKFAPPSEWGSFVQYFTGNKEHNIALREVALKKGLSLSEHGIKIKKTGGMKKFASEQEFYKFVGYKFIPPEERVGKEELKKYRLA